MINRFLIALACLFLISCSNTPKSGEPASREPQSEQQVHAEEYAKHEQTFQNLMKAEAPTEKEKNIIRAKKVAAYLKRQMGFFYIGQGMVNTFDKELDRLYQQKTKKPQADINTDSLRKLQFELNISREFIERNLHELQFIYSRLLEEAHKEGGLQTASKWTLSSMDTFLEKGWKKGDQWAVLSLAQEFESINTEFKVTNPNVKTMDFSRYTKLNSAQRNAAYQQSLKFYESRRKRAVDSFIQKEWDEHSQSQEDRRKEVSQERTPQAVGPYPDSGSAGNMNGSNFEPGVWALTFDDGPHPKHTRGMLDALQRGGYKGTFFWLTKNMKMYPGILQEVHNEQSRRASHSYSHANLPKLSETALSYEIEQAAQDFEQVIGARPTFFRCPYGACGPNGSRIRQKISEGGMIHAMWNVDSLDWQDKNPHSIFERVKKQMVVNGRGIVLFHDIHAQSVEATKLVVDYIKERGDWQVLPLDEIVQMKTGSNYPSP